MLQRMATQGSRLCSHNMEGMQRGPCQPSGNKEPLHKHHDSPRDALPFKAGDMLCSMETTL